MNTTLTIEMMSAMPAARVELTPSFDGFFRAEYPGLVAVAAALAGSIDDAEDLVQDTMVKALLRWDRVGRLQRPGGWCHHVLINACRSWFRRRRTRSQFIARQRREEPWSGRPSPDSLVFWAAVRDLPERPRQAVALYYAGDHSVAEVAEILKVPEGTIRSDLSRARVVLAKELGMTS
jgi:RNA polymerase sigma-70 factor, ECF subfamily